MRGSLGLWIGISTKADEVGATLVLCVVAAFLVSSILTLILKKIGSAFGMVDKPNSRSSHVRPTVRGGGLAIAISVSLAATILRSQGIIGLPLLVVILLAGGAIAAVGFMDDRKSLPVGFRIVAHGLAAAFALYTLGGMPKVLWSDRLVDLGFAGEVLGWLAIVWMLNLFNFMDGIDGIAGSEAVFVTLSGAWLASLDGPSTPATAIALVVGAASLGFLVWNWPPAKIFMGDVGSGYLGFIIAAVILQSVIERPVMLYVWSILSGIFIVDATVTLLCRLIRGERIQEAHRAHAYQRLARRWNSHRKVTGLVWLINVGWLFPCALYCATHPGQSREVLAVALLPLVCLVLMLGVRTDAAR
jgi:Fuc2NAc and GlcNAc transferase